MNLDSMLAFIGIVVAIYALAGPVQRRSMHMFVSPWIVLGSLVVATGLIIARDVCDLTGVPLCPLGSYGLRIGSFFVPIAGVSLGIWQWRRKRMTKRNAAEFPELLAVSLREGKFDEAKQIVQANRRRFDELPSATWGSFFDRRVVHELVSSWSFLHFELIAEEDRFLNLDNPFGAVDAVLREMLRADTSPLKSAVLSKYGGVEHYSLSFPDEHRELIERTLQNPKWYDLVSAQVSLIHVAVEELWSGEYDEKYNQASPAYQAHDATSTRSNCQIYLSLKTMILGIRAAVEAGAPEDIDVYVPGPQQLFHQILDRSEFTPPEWEGSLADPEFPTPYSYLLYEILGDYEDLCRAAFKYAVGDERIAPPDSRARSMALCWVTCVWDIACADEHVSLDFQLSAITRYLNFVLKLKHAPQEFAIIRSVPDDGRDAWWDLFVDEVRKLLSRDERKKEKLIRAIASLDIPKSYVSDGRKRLMEDLGVDEERVEEARRRRR